MRDDSIMSKRKAYNKNSRGNEVRAKATINQNPSLGVVHAIIINKKTHLLHK